MDAGLIERLEFWTKGQLDEKCRVLGIIGDDPVNPRYLVDHFTLFIHVPYDSIRTSGTAMTAYRAAIDHPIGVFIIRVDTWDARHVLLGFETKEHQDAFLASEGVLQDRQEYRLRTMKDC